MPVQLPGGGGLAQLLVKVLGKPDAGGKVDGKGLAGQPAPAQGQQQGPEGPKKGLPIGDGTVLTGVGFNAQDRTGAQKNVHEKETVARFLKDPELDKLGRAAKPESEDVRAKAEDRGPERGVEAREKQDAQRAEVRREEKADDAKQLQARDSQREEQQREKEREKERERHKGDQQQQEEPEGHAWMEPDRERTEEEPPKDGSHDADVLGEAHQCKGESGGGVRCLRKPLEGASYCREHLIVPRTIEVL